MMLRTRAPRAVLRSFSKPASLSHARLNALNAHIPYVSKICTASSTLSKRPLALQKGTTLSLVRYQTTIDRKHEEAVAHQTLKPTPETVSTTSSTHPIVGEVSEGYREPDPDMMAGMRGDFNTIVETFSLKEVPREAYYIGLAGVLPYLATSMSTIYCAWEINHSAATGIGLLMSHRTAELALHVLEPLQVGYGAVIISFLGAIHWGLEWAAYGGHQGYRRYAYGVIAPAVAWPTILLPVEYALIGQFLAFNFLYYADAQATRRGWTPAWYGVYRFVLTFIVGASIVATLIGRGQVTDRIGKLPSPAERVLELRENSAQELEKEEAARVAEGKDTEYGGIEQEDEE